MRGRPALERAATAAAAAGLAGVFWSVLASNDPHRRFTALRGATGAFALLIPDWRFFAPNPSDHDFELVFRVRSTAGETSAWDQAFAFGERSWRHVFFYARRRREKGLFDTIQSMVTALPDAPVDSMVLRAPYKVLAGYVGHQVRVRYAGRLPAGFQFAVVRSPGYDEQQQVHSMFLSPYIPLDGSAVGAPSSEAGRAASTAEELQ